MPPLSHQDRRKERRRLIKVGRDALGRGFSDNLDDEIPVGVALLLHEKLTEGDNPLRAGEAAAFAEQLLDRSNAAYERDPAVACRKGCAHCCVTVAAATPPEVFRVADWIRRNRLHSPTMSPAAVVARARLKAGPTLEAMFAARVPCPALVEDACGVHPARPLTCRQFLSTSLAACIASFGRGAGSVPFVVPATDRGMLARILLAGAMKAAGFRDTSYELSGALARALEDEAAEARWLAGEDVFQGVIVTPRPGDTQRVVDDCARLIKANI